MKATAIREDTRARVEDALRDRFSQHTEAAEAYGAEFASLWRTAADHALGGKLIRPCLLLDVHHALTPDADAEHPPHAAVEIATCIELLHYAFLLHDDVIDGDLTRRGRPNLIGELAARGGTGDDEARLHWARSSAILMGDLLLSAALMGFSRADLPSGTRSALLDLVDEAIRETVAGEHTDVALSLGMLGSDLSTVLSMSANKTAAYSFTLPLRVAALLAGASPAADEALRRAGRHLGLAYQLQDDVLCAFGDHRTHGKDAFSDLREGKETAIIAFARTTSTWSRIAPRFGSAALSLQDTIGMRDLLRECGAERFVTGLIDDQLDAVRALMAEAEATGEISANAARAVLVSASRLEGRRA
ncbi:polyprenyl synthetase family protein [Microbacterium sp. SD291]|uniref:polyprenyl synthetase family protein n=1 Tax=Microbacterium sp. SD291 TaxID=2782007 RepID=UPI001A95CFC4|nr:polyprenyl synthetase family protein [Microbacterium sp. SD291]MBO0980016.1 polyprenyl synthetase family protein [Microbacterium sp. SD291]